MVDFIADELEASPGNFELGGAAGRKHGGLGGDRRVVAIDEFAAC
jgi:hypothetical protein